MLTLDLKQNQTALRMDEGGVIRLGKSRITLDLVAEQYDNGMTAEEFVAAYESADPADVHDAIAFYLRHGEEVRGYLKKRREQAESVRTCIESQLPRIMREELLARNNSSEPTNAAIGH